MHKLCSITGSPPGLPQVCPGGVQAGAEDRDQVQDRAGVHHRHREAVQASLARGLPVGSA